MPQFAPALAAAAAEALGLEAEAEAEALLEADALGQVAVWLAVTIPPVCDWD